MNTIRHTLYSVAIVLTAMWSAVTAEVIVVNNTDDAGPGSLRAAVDEANVIPGADRIVFDIGGGGPHIIQLLSALPGITDTVEIDGFTQAGVGVYDIEINGALAVGPFPQSGPTLRPGSSWSTIRGLIMSGFEFAGLRLLGNVDSPVVGCSVEQCIVENNGEGIRIRYGGENRIVGCMIVRNDEHGVNLSVNLAGNRVGGLDDGQGNLVSDNGGDGLRVVASDGSILEGNICQNNGPEGVGILVFGDGNLLRGNLISGNKSTLAGLAVPGSNNIVEMNVISHNAGPGIISSNLFGGGQGNTIRTNSVHDNVGLGIDLTAGFSGDGPTPNDPGDLDEDGANSFQNYPVLSAERSLVNPAQVIIRGDLSATPQTMYVIQVFSAEEGEDYALPDGTVFHTAEGKLHLGDRTVVTNPDGRANFSLPAEVPLGHFVVATATNLSTGNTSEFSEALDVDGVGLHRVGRVPAPGETLEDVLAELQSEE